MNIKLNQIPRKILLFLIFINLINYCFCEDCPRDKPILKKGICVSEYCTYEEFENRICIVSNPFLRTQWLDEIHFFSYDRISDICTATNWQGDLFLMGQGYSEENSRDKYIYAFYKNGNGLFYDEEYEYHYSFETIQMPEDRKPETFYSVHIDDKQYLLSSQVENEMFLIDIYNKNYTIFTLDTYNHYHYSGTLIRLKGYYDDEEIDDEDERVYFTDYTNCLDRGTYNDCFLGLRIFRFNQTDLTIVKEVNNEIQINPLSRETCFQNADLFIQCVYTSYSNEEKIYNRVTSLFDYKTLELVHTEMIEEDIDSQISFDSTLHMKGNFFVTGYSYPNDLNMIKLLLKKFVVEKNDDETQYILEDYLPFVGVAFINQEKKYNIERGISKRNFMVKISDTKFAILINEYSDSREDSTWNKKLLILICTIFNDSRLSIRYYRINFEYYNLLIYEDLRGYTLNNFFGVLLESVVGVQSFSPRAIFLTFGYVDSSYEDTIDKDLKLNDTSSVIRINEYITGIENNLFGYKFLGVKILKLPNPNKSGYFVKQKTNEIVYEGDIVSVDTVLRFILARKLNIEDEFTIQFAGAVQEPTYDEMNEIAEKVEMYPINNIEAERLFYTPQIFLGKVVNYVFEIRCFESCNGCTKLSNDPTNQYCIHCKPGYHFEEGTSNCVQEISCHPNCGICFTPPDIKNNNMNCLSCKEDFYYFEESNACLNCPNYVSYDLKECIDEIPEGFYLDDPELKTLGMCHELCKSCNEAPEMFGMHCSECKYHSEKFFPEFDGDCPTENYDEEVEEEEQGGECPRHKPILVRLDYCDMTYCNPQDYEDSICIVDNSYAKEQWLNNIQRFGEGHIAYPSVTYGIDGEFILFGIKIDPSSNKYESVIYATNLIGQPIFFNEDKDEKKYFKSIEIPENVYLDSVRLVENFENGNTFLLSTQIGNKMYGINYSTGEIKEYNFKVNSHSSDDIFIFNDKEEYFTNFISCQESLDDCYMMLRKFKLNSKDEIEIIKESKPVEEINSETNFICIPGIDNYIQCVYTSENDGYFMHKLGYFDYDSLELKFTIDLEGSFNPNAFLDSMIRLNDEAFVVGYSTEKNIVKVLIKTLEFYINQNIPNVGNYIIDVPHILLNTDDYFNFSYKEGLADMNSLCRINDYKFALLINSFNDMRQGTEENSEIMIYIFNIFNQRSNINVRGYSINFKLYNMVNFGKIYGYSLDQFFGIVVELSSPRDRKIVNTAFMTFGYVNTTGESYITDNDFVIGNSAYSKAIKFSKYIQNIENNLFGYEFLGIFILDLPDPSIGTFIDEDKNEVHMSSTLKLESEIKLQVNTKRTYDSGYYSISFAGAVREAEFDEHDMFANLVYYYPLEDLETDERDFYSPQTFLGRPFEYNFELTGGTGKPKEEEEEEEEEKGDDSGCYPSCESCYKNSKDDDDHQCKVCKTDYYFKEYTNNCYKEINEYYFFDEDKEVFSQCEMHCLTCRGKPESLDHMNCLSCEEDYDFYDKSKNCLNCPKYVNYEQTECISKIPEGYYLLDKSLGTIEKCNELCKTCSGGEYYDEDDNFYMNCDTCKYENKDFVPKNEGDCPSSPGDTPAIDDEPVDGQCPKEKPILKQNKCQSIYCTEKELENGTCEIYNKYVKTQWLNKFNIFDDNLSSFVSYDTNDKGEIYFMAQREDDKTFKKYVYGFDSKGKGILYDKDKKKYVSFKTFSSEFSGYTEKAKYIEINDEKYLLNMLKDQKIYLINIDTDEVISHEFEYTPYSSDKLIKLNDRTNAYIFDFIYCVDELVLDKCYVGFANYRFDGKNSFILQKTNSDEDTLQVNYDTKLTCFKNSYQIIQCTYSLNEDEDEDHYEYTLGLFNQDSLNTIQIFTIDNTIDLHPNFDSMIELKDNAFIIAYSIATDVIKVLFKTLNYQQNKYSLSNYLQGIDEIIINEDKSYVLEGGNCFRNSLFKLNDDEFVMLLNDNKYGTGYSSVNNAMVIITFKIYNNNRNVLVRHYKIDFTLYNMFIDGDLMGYQLNGFFGVLAELTSPTEKYLSRAAFLTFGYINATDDVEADIGTDNLITNRKKIIVKDYIKTMENNLFGYSFEGVKILSLPDESKAGYLLNTNYSNRKLKVGDIININSQLSFVKSINPVDGEYSFSFAGVAKEPDFKEQNNYANKVVNYPNDITSESYFSQQRTLIGREFTYNFIIGKKQGDDDDRPKQNCFKNCQLCDAYSENENDQKCVTCKSGYYFKEGTNNCYVEAPSKTYFDSEKKVWAPCHKNCLTCSGKEVLNQFNCLTCESGAKYYPQTKNCLKCPTFVNYEQTGCLLIIPNGYYLKDKELGTVGKCYDLCETCNKGPSKSQNILAMNCLTCKYENKGLKLEEGECPASPGKQAGDDKKNDEEEEEEENAQKLTILIFTIIICIVLAVLIIGVIIYLACYNMKAKKKTENNNDYYNIGGKDIPFEDENNNNNNNNNNNDKDFAIN